MKRLNHSVLHAFLFAVFPIMALMAFNISELQLGDGMRALLVLLLFAVLLLTVSRAMVRDWQRAALFTSITFLFMFSYGPVYDYLKNIELFDVVIGRHRWLIPVYGVLLMGGSIYVLRSSKLIRLTEFANITASALVVLSLVQIVSFEVRASQSDSNSNSLLDLYSIALPDDGPPRDVYYIVLDEYARDDVLLELGYNNAPFLESLEELGFSVVRCSRSNYALTSLSLTSSMNMDYLDELGIGLLPDDMLDRADFDTTIRRDSRVIRIFEQLGYTTVGFETGRRLTNFETADYFLAPGQSWLDRIRMGQGLTELESLLLFNSVGRVLFEENITLPEFSNAELVLPEGRDHYNLINYVLEQLRNMPERESPKFVFVHMLIPHAPFVFGPDGSFAQPENDLQGYLNQVEFINREMLSIFDILIDSPMPPIIILQSDHGGPGDKVPERLYNLEAFYFPEQDDFDLYQQMTPVNIFRYVFSSYFGSGLQQVENRSYASSYGFPFHYTEIIDSREECAP